jgi:hypothetical protein
VRRIAEGQLFSRTKVWDLLRGESWPVDEAEARALIRALGGSEDDDARGAQFYNEARERRLVTVPGSMYRIDSFSTRAAGLSVAEALAQPSKLLNVRNAVVPFTGRDDILKKDLPRWLAGADGPLSVRLVSPAGGWARRSWTRGSRG